MSKIGYNLGEWEEVATWYSDRSTIRFLYHTRALSVREIREIGYTLYLRVA